MAVETPVNCPCRLYVITGTIDVEPTAVPAPVTPVLVILTVNAISPVALTVIPDPPDTFGFVFANLSQVVPLNTT